MQIFIVLLLLSANAQARVYKSVDKDGNVTYSQTKPTDNENVETIKTPKAKPAPTPVETPNPATAASPEADSEAQKESPEIAEKNKQIEAENAEIKKQNCANSKSRLADLNSAGRIKFTGEDGNLKWASEEEVQARRDELQANVDKWCN